MKLIDVQSLPIRSQVVRQHSPAGMRIRRGKFDCPARSLGNLKGRDQASLDLSGYHDLFFLLNLLGHYPTIIQLEGKKWESGE